MYKHILTPTDGSELSDNAATGGVALAQALGARVTGVHVLPTRIGLLYGDIVWVDERTDMQMRDAASRYLDRIQDVAKREGVPFDRVLKAGDQVWRAIIDVAEEKRCDLIVMAAHGRRGLSAMLIGSETNKVLIYSKIPVLVYR